MLQFYLSNIKYISAFGNVLPFLVYSKFKLTIKKSAVLKLASRLTIGDKNIPEVAPNTTSLIMLENSNALFGEGVVIGGGSLIFVKEKAHFEIGNNTYLTSNVHIESINSIKIGSNCAISWGVTIIDNDHHKIIYNTPREETGNSNVEIGDHVWIGCNVTILKNTKIGDNSIVAAGSVVLGSFPDHVLIGGSPAKVLKTNINWE